MRVCLTLAIMRGGGFPGPLFWHLHGPFSVIDLAV